MRVLLSIEGNPKLEMKPVPVKVAGAVVLSRDSGKIIEMHNCSPSANNELGPVLAASKMKVASTVPGSETSAGILFMNPVSSKHVVSIDSIVSSGN